MLIRQLILITLIILPTVLAAHDLPEEEKGPWENSLKAGFNLTSGNSDTSLLNIGFSSNYEKDKDIFKFNLDHGFGETENQDSGITETNIDYTFIESRYKRVLSEKFYTGFGTDFQRNEISEVKYRVFLNPVVGFFLFKNDNGFLDVFTGPSYIFEEVGGVSDDYLAPRIGNSFEYQITENAKVFEKFNIFISAEDSENYIITGEAGIETKISDGVNLIVKLQNVYDNQPAEDLQRNDLAMLTSIGVDF